MSDNICKCGKVIDKSIGIATLRGPVQTMTGNIPNCGPCSVSQSVTCLATDANLTANPGVSSSIQARSHTFVEIDHEIISTVILLPCAESFKKGCCHSQAKLCSRSTG